MRSIVAAASLLALAVVLFSDGTRTLFAPMFHASSLANQVPAASMYNPTRYAAPVAQVTSQPERDSSGWSYAMLAGLCAGAAAGFAMKSKSPSQGSEVEMTPDVESGAIVVQLAGQRVAALAVAGETPSDLHALAQNLNPTVGFYDPLGLAEAEFWNQSNEATIGFLRHAEIKHGRVAMAGFVGFCVHANGIHFPWTIPGDEICAKGVSPVELWQNIPEVAKWQIIAAVGIFEGYSEAAMSYDPSAGGHYMRGGKPGYFPPFKQEGTDKVPFLPHPVPFNLYDPFDLFGKMTDDQKATRLQMEINNGRLAMIGLMSLLSEGAVPGSVPALKGLIPFSGPVNVMSPGDFTKGFFG